MKKQPIFRRADLILAAVCTVICLFLFWPSKGGAPSQAVLYCEGEEVGRIALSEVDSPYTIELGDNPAAVVQVEPGRIRYLSAGCPDQLCVRAGWLSKPGDTAACLPARTVISIEGERNTGVDVQTY